jgi:hypothetical protein
MVGKGIEFLPMHLDMVRKHGLDTVKQPPPGGKNNLKKHRRSPYSKFPVSGILRYNIDIYRSATIELFTWTACARDAFGVDLATEISRLEISN